MWPTERVRYRRCFLVSARLLSQIAQIERNPLRVTVVVLLAGTAWYEERLIWDVVITQKQSVVP